MKGERLDRPELKEIEDLLRTRAFDLLVCEDMGRLVRGTAAKDLFGIALDHGTRARGAEPVTALDHDMSPAARLVPLGILALSRGPVAIHQPWLLFGHSNETSDFIAAGLNQWRTERKAAHPGVRRLHLELDNGPEVPSSRTQFMNRLVAFADHHRVEIELAYLPPYHRKYNPVERRWGISTGPAAVSERS